MIFNQVDVEGDRLVVSQYGNDNYFIEILNSSDSIVEFRPDQMIELADAIYARESERFKESL